MPFAETWMDLETVTQSEINQKEKQMSYTNTGMWTLEKWCRGTHLQSRSRDTDIENKREDSKEEKEGWDELGDWGGHTHTRCSASRRKLTRTSQAAQGAPLSALRGPGRGADPTRRGTHTADSRRCTAEANSAL